MSNDARALVYRGALRGGSRGGEEIAVAPVPRIGLWDVSLVLGDLPELVKQASAQLFTVTAPVPAGMVGPGPCVVEERLLPHALRVARGLRLDWLIALTPYRLATPGRRVYADRPVAIVSIAGEFAGRAPARRALAAAQEVLPPEVAAALDPVLRRVGSRRKS